MCQACVKGISASAIRKGRPISRPPCQASFDPESPEKAPLLFPLGDDVLVEEDVTLTLVDFENNLLAVR